MSTTAKPTSSSAVENPLKALLKFGQSVWLDYIRRNLLTTGELKRLIEEDGLRGMTSNPSIFEKAITGSTDYTQTLQELEKRKDLDAKGRYEELAIKDIQDAADIPPPGIRTNRKSATATSAWKFRPTSRTRLRKLWTKRGACGSASAAKTS